MSQPPVGAAEFSALGKEGHAFTPHPNRSTNLGPLRVSRALPIRERRMVGPWCFLDRFGPATFSGAGPMNVPPHPHIGLQTVTWLLEGEVLHSDSLGAQAVVRPGGVNVMTAGSGIAHAEETPREHSGRLDGVQLWVALPDTHRHTQPSFDHVEQAPVTEVPGGVLRVFAGAYNGLESRGRRFSDLVGLDIETGSGARVELALHPEYEYAVQLLRGDGTFENRRLEEHTLYYLGTQRSRIELSSHSGSRVLLIGGPPFPERILMWWNFVARTPEEIAEARADWEAHRRFGEVIGEHDARLTAPDLVRFARPNPVS